jgi:hypothetical protein
LRRTVPPLCRPLLALFGALLVALPQFAMASADARRSLAQACAAARSDGERHRLGCWRLDSAERSSGRPYDRNAVRDWEQPRAWERR